jgi:hypothetical protein
MVDRSAENEQTLRENMMVLSGEERIIIGAQMFDRFRERLRASLPLGLSETEQRQELFKRIYGKELDVR